MKIDREKVKAFLDQDVKYRTSRYQGRGRPRTSDFSTIKRKQVPDMRAFELFEAGFKPENTYEKRTNQSK